MQTGKLDQKVILEQPTVVNNSGEVTKTWAVVATVWAYITSPRGSESFEAARQNARETLRIKLRFRDDVKQTWRLKWNNQYYNVTYVDRTCERKGELWLTVEGVGVQ